MKTYQPKKFMPQAAKKISAKALGLPLLMAMCLAVPARSQVDATVIVDFGRTVPVKNQVGFLHGAKAGSPPDSLIRNLRPALIRDGDLRNYGLAKTLGAHFQFVLSDTWGYAPDKMPYTDWTAWEAHVRKVAQSTKGLDISWDIWNEPVEGGFWPGTQAQYFETFQRSYAVIRQELGPEARISGPCIAVYRPQVIRDFLDYCLANKVEVNILTWHELNYNVVITDIAKHLRDMRAEYLDNPAYAALKMKEIHINEIVAESDQYHPGEAVGWFDQLERGGADLSARGCWKENCGNNTLDGLLEPGTLSPRPTWWIDRFYAVGSGSRVADSSTDERIAALASRQSGDSGRGQVLLGHLGRTSLPSPVTGKVTLQLTHLLADGDPEGTLSIRINRIPNLEDAPGGTPVTVWEGEVPMTHGVAQVTLPDFRLHEAYQVSLGAAHGILGFTTAQAAIRRGPSRLGTLATGKTSGHVTGFSPDGSRVERKGSGKWQRRHAGAWFQAPSPDK